MITCSTCSTHNPEGKSVCSSCGTALQAAPPSSALPPNSSLKDGAFKIASVLGQGGFGITYKGGDMGLKRYVAIKELFPQGSARNGLQVVPTSSSDQLSFDRDKAGFLREAQTLARFNHPGIVRVFTSFEENNTAYMVMEYLQGQTLQQRLEQQGVLSEKETLQLARQVGEALSMVHQGGLLHRDIKPDNILLTDEGRAVLIDFGTARAFASNKTVRQTAMLTPGYAPLEQYGQQAKFGPYTDVYALGATLYHCLTGQLPPPATDRLSGVDLQPPDRANPSLSSAVSQGIMAALEIKASDRPKNVEEFLGILEGTSMLPRPSGTAGVPGDGQRDGIVEFPPSSPFPTPPPPPDTLPPAPVANNKSWQPLLGVGIAGMVLFGALLPFLLGWREDARQASCQSNLKQIGLGMMQYAQDYDERYPLAAGGDIGWANALLPYTKSAQLFQCPGNRAKSSDDPSRSGYTDYWFNRRLSGVSDSRIINPSRIVLIGEGDRNDPDSDATYSFSISSPPPVSEAVNRHGGGSNYAYLDGSVEWYAP